MIAKRGVSALILVDRADLMNQWLKRLDEFLDIDEELPEYHTKTGRTKKEKIDRKMTLWLNEEETVFAFMVESE